MNIHKNGSTLKQMAYARRAWGAQGESKKQIALDVGYSPSAANSVVSKIESKKGYNNAMAKLAADSNNVALSVLAEFKSRGVKDFSNKDLIGALNAIGGAWDRFNKGFIESQKPKQDDGKNKLRTVILQSINRQIVHPKEETEVISPVEEAIPAEFEEVKKDPSLDF